MLISQNLAIAVYITSHEQCACQLFNMFI